MAPTPDAPAPYLCLDIETARQDALILHEIGLYRPDTGARARISGRDPALVARLDALTDGAEAVLGHNIVAFDGPTLAVLHPDLALHRLPLIDTLELSPLAFPRNPYHHLVKDYRLCATTRNDPVRDAELAYRLYLDEREALSERAREHPDEILSLHFLIARQPDTAAGKVLAAVRGAPAPAFREAAVAWMRASAGKVCVSGQRHLLGQWLPDPAWGMALAYVLAWLGVAGGNSVLPPWVRHRFPQAREAIARLRDIPCDDPGCVWCREQHDLARVLPRIFPGINDFRPTPAAADGRSLQRAIVENGFAARPTLAILPTGGGKSLCFQLPALSRFYRNGALTVAISPLQSLMKDQVDNLEARGITCAGYLNGLLTPLERAAMLEKIRLGDLGLIYVAPEQFRNRSFIDALAHREIGAWVFDEAHCLSKWGHDFRPDYLYVSRLVRQRHRDGATVPLFCFTATAKPDVVADIREHFQSRLGLTLEVLEGGVSRDNLNYEVRAVPAAAKYCAVLELLREAQREEGGAIVFCARQRTTEDLAKFLNQAGIDCGHFHGGLSSEEKRAIQEGFIAGQPRVIAATNAFGMGVDKSDVRLVIHLDTPGSLENYLQEAGRAGRDQGPARCVLLYDEADLDVQFRLLKSARLTQHDIHSILKALRHIERKDRGDGEVVVTSGEILLEIPEQHRIDPDASDADTKVRIAVAWLEQARLLERHENHTRVFPGSLRVDDLDAARARLSQRLGRDADSAPYLRILALLIESADDQGISTDSLMMATGKDSRTLRAMLRELDQWGLLANDTEIGVTFQRNPGTAQRLAGLERLEQALIERLRTLAPDADQGDWQILDARRLCDTLRRDTDIAIDPPRLTRLLKSFAEPFGESSAGRACIALRPAGLDNRWVRVQRPWSAIESIAQRRLRLAQALVSQFQQRRQGNSLLVVCTQGELERALQADIALQDLDIRDWDRALAAALLHLDANEVLHLARGKAVFRAAMRIVLDADRRRHQFKRSDYAELALHYQDKIVQVHVMAEYAKLGIRKIQAAMAFILDYFRLDRAELVRRYFAGRQDILAIATTETAHRRILVDLRNPAQQAIVAAPLEQSHLVLAGPGAGKTRVIVHRVAWLLREAMIQPQAIMVLAYNRSAALEIRRRLWALVGADAAGVTVQTLHGLAMRLTGTSYAVAMERGETPDFDAVIRQASAYLSRAEDDEGIIHARDRALAGLRVLLVDEYQDINGDHDDLISALAGRTLQSEEDRLALFAVGDDDQNIYAFDGANVRYIRRFEADYQAQRHHLIENYRSTAHIIQCANQVIAPARDRMKAEQTITVDHARRDQPAGGAYATLDPVAGGRVQVLEVPPDPSLEVQIALAELHRLSALAHSEGGAWGRCAVIARRWTDLEPLAALCRLRGIPARLPREDRQPSLHATREGRALLDLLEGRQRRAPRLLVRAGALSRWFQRRFGTPAEGLIKHPIRAALARFIVETEAAAPVGYQVASELVDSLYETGTGARALGDAQPNGPLLLTTAHRAKGLEFDHVLILDAGGWAQASDEERRLYYVAMTRARATLTLCETIGRRHPFTREVEGLALRTRPKPPPPEPGLDHRTWTADPSQIVLSWPGYFTPSAPIHRALAALDVGSPLELRERADGMLGWELTDRTGIAVTRMAARFSPPEGEIVAVRVFAVLVREAKDETGLRCSRWELVLPEIEVARTRS